MLTVLWMDEHIDASFTIVVASILWTETFPRRSQAVQEAEEKSKSLREAEAMSTQQDLLSSTSSPGKAHQGEGSRA